MEEEERSRKKHFGIMRREGEYESIHRQSSVHPSLPSLPLPPRFHSIPPLKSLIHELIHTGNVSRSLHSFPIEQILDRSRRGVESRGSWVKCRDIRYISSCETVGGEGSKDLRSIRKRGNWSRVWRRVSINFSIITPDRCIGTLKKRKLRALLRLDPYTCYYAALRCLSRSSRDPFFFAWFLIEAITQRRREEVGRVCLTRDDQ